MVEWSSRALGAETLRPVVSWLLLQPPTRYRRQGASRFRIFSEADTQRRAVVLRRDAACQPQKRFGSVKRLVFDNGWAVEAKAKKRLVEAFQPPARGSSTPPCKKVRLAKAVVINDNIKTATTQVGHKPHDAGGGPPRWSVAHCKSIHRDDFVDSR